MPGFDDKLTRELDRAARPAAPDVARTFDDVARRRAHRTVVRKVQVVAVVIALLAGTAGAFVLLDDRFEGNQPGDTETIAPPLQQMSAWRLQFRPVSAIGTTGLNLTCTPAECTEDDLDPGGRITLEGSDGDVYQLGPAFADASNVTSATAFESKAPSGEASVDMVAITLDDEGIAALATATEDASTAEPPQDRIAAVFDGAVISAPVVFEPIASGEVQLSGLGEEGSKALADELTRGSATGTTTPTLEPSPVVKGEDVGLPTRLCEVEVVTGIDMMGDGTPTTAWTGNPVGENGRCPKDLSFLVAVDVTGDGSADLQWGPIEQCQYMGCAPLGGADLDGDGDDELVIHTYFSIIDHLYFDIQPLDDGGFGFGPILVAEPGRPIANVAPGDPLMTSAGGDEGYSSWMRCEDYPDAPVLVWTWAYAAVESGDPVEWHETKLRLQGDGMFHVVGANDFTLPLGQDPGVIRSTDPACGLDFNILAPPPNP